MPLRIFGADWRFFLGAVLLGLIAAILPDYVAAGWALFTARMFGFFSGAVFGTGYMYGRRS